MGIEDSESYCALMEHFFLATMDPIPLKQNMEEAPEQVIALLNKFAVFPQTISLIALIIAPVNLAKLIWAAELSWMISISSTAFKTGQLKKNWPGII